MYQKYLLTGATGFLGRAVVDALIKDNVKIRALVMRDDPLASMLPPSVDIVYGDVCDDQALKSFFSGADHETCVIHMAGIVSVASNPGMQLYRVNVNGTNNILTCCERRHVGKLVYVSDMATNNVLRQLRGNREIAPGTLIESGTSIDLVVGLNPEDNQTYVPNVIGLKYLRAVDVVHGNSLNIKKLNFDESVKNYSDSLDAVVYRQGPEGSKAPILIGSDVTLYLSVDPAKTIMKK